MDIKKYEFDDCEITTVLDSDDVIKVLSDSESYTFFSKDDVIAMAKHFNVTKYDLQA